MSYFKRCALLTSSAIMLLISLPGHAGFSVSGTKLLEGNGNEFIMRGVNHPHTWYRNETSSFANIAATGANTVRVVLATGGQWARNDGADVADVISRCKANKLICVLEVHDSTGYTEKAEAVPITDAVNYWTSPDILSVIQGEEDYVIINIANEPYGNQASVSQYVNGHKDAIQALRAAGISHTLMVDAANWGQDWQFIMRDNAPEIFNSDPDKNILFDVHMYEVYKDASTQRAYLQAFQNHNLALVIGEFGPIHSGQTIDAQAIISQAQEFGVGYLGWSWSGNGGCCVDLDLVQNFNPNNRTSWGTLLIEGTDGIMQTSTTATIYNNGGNIAPIANFTFQATQLTVSFDSSGSRDPDNSPNALTYSWDFGDGNSSVSANPSHTYATASSTQGYSVVLTISDGQDSRSITKSVVVTSWQP